MDQVPSRLRQINKPFQSKSKMAVSGFLNFPWPNSNVVVEFTHVRVVFSVARLGLEFNTEGNCDMLQKRVCYCEFFPVFY